MGRQKSNFFRRKTNISSKKSETLYQKSLDDWKPKACVYYCKKDHKSIDYKTITKVENRKNIISEKTPCFQVWNIEQVSVAAKKPVNNVKVKTNRHFVNSQVEWWQSLKDQSYIL